MTEKLSRILIVAITRMGDLLQATPIFIGLKEEHPDCEITVLTDIDMVKFCGAIPGIDRVVEIDLALMLRLLRHEKESIIDAYRYIDKLVSDLREFDFEMVLNISSSSYSALLIKLLNVDDSRGWVSDGEGNRLIQSPWSRLFSANVYHSNRDFNSINIVDFLRSAAGVTRHPLSLKYLLDDASRKSGNAKLSELGLSGSGPLICLQAGASQEKRQWAPQRFAELVQQLVEGIDARVVFTGSRGELAIIEQVIKLYPHPNVGTVAGQTTFSELAGVLEAADLLITGDTGPMHMSIAVGTPVVAVFLASALCYETGPYSSGNLVVQALLSCCPCNPNFPCARPDCHEQVSPELIYYLASKRLELNEDELWDLEIPDHLANPSETSVFVTYFDRDRFLDYRKLNSGGQRRGYSAEVYDVARAAHRQMWKEEFGALLDSVSHTTLAPSSMNEVEKCGRDPAGVGATSPEGRGASRIPVEVFPVNKIAALCRQGIESVDRLVELIRDETAPPRLLGEVNRALEENDKSIEDIGLAFPFAGAVTRLFVIEKENMRGNDALVLASEMRELYRSLERRVLRLWELFAR